VTAKLSCCGTKILVTI